MSYSKEQITAALLLFDKTGSPAKVKELLGYPSISMLYLWKEWYPDLYKARIILLKKVMVREIIGIKPSIQLVNT